MPHTSNEGDRCCTDCLTCWGNCQQAHTYQASELFTVNGDYPKHYGSYVFQHHVPDAHEYFNDSCALLDLTSGSTMGELFPNEVELHPQIWQVFHVLPKLSTVIESFKIWSDKWVSQGREFIDPNCVYGATIHSEYKCIAVFAYQYDGYGVVELCTPVRISGLKRARTYKMVGNEYVLVGSNEVNDE